MTNKSQSIINRRRLDQKVAALEEGCLEMFKAIAWNRDQDRYDFVRLVEIINGLNRVEELVAKKKIALATYVWQEKELTGAFQPPRPWWKQPFRKENN